MVLSDGPVGVRGDELGRPRLGRDHPVADRARRELGSRRSSSRSAQLLGTEARRKGVDVLLAPTVNLHRTPLRRAALRVPVRGPVPDRPDRHRVRHGRAAPRGRRDGQALRRQRLRDRADDLPGRHRGTAAARGLPAPVRGHRRRRAAVAGDGRLQRLQRPDDDRERAARRTAERRWGFDGVVVSDWNAVRSTVAGRAGRHRSGHARAGDPVERRPLLDAVRSGEVPEAAIDRKLRRLLTPGRAGRRACGLRQPSPHRHRRAGTAALLREAAAAGTVLVRNDGTLPLAAPALRRVAVLGPAPSTSASRAAAAHGSHRRTP